MIVDDSQVCKRVGFNVIQIYDQSSWFDLLVARGSLGLNTSFIASRNLRFERCPSFGLPIDEGNENMDSNVALSSGGRQICLPFSANNRELAKNFWSVFRSCNLLMVPWFFIYEKSVDFSINTVDKFLKLFCSRLASPVLLIRARQAHSSAIECPAGMNSEEFLIKVESIFCS